MLKTEYGGEGCDFLLSFSKALKTLVNVTEWTACNNYQCETCNYIQLGSYDAFAGPHWQQIFLVLEILKIMQFIFCTSSLVEVNTWACFWVWWGSCLRGRSEAGEQTDVVVRLRSYFLPDFLMPPLAGGKKTTGNMFKNRAHIQKI